MKVRDPSGQTWRVTRRWVPWRRRVRDPRDLTPDLLDIPFGLGDDLVVVVVGTIVIIIALPVLLIASFVLLAGLELALLLLVLPLAVLGRMARGRHWAVEVRRGFRPWAEESVGDWHASGARIRSWSEEIQEGELPAGPQRKPEAEHP